MKQFYILFFLLISSYTLIGQTAGTTAPDWTLTDLNGEVHNLYDVLEDGKSAVIDFSTTWCGPCWAYHQTGTLESVYDTYGPNGTDEVRVYYIESDASTNDECLYGNTNGCSGSTQGDWVTGSNFPIFNPPNEFVPSSYNVTAYPTLIAVCPDKKLYPVGTIGLDTWGEWITQSCALDVDYLSSDTECYGDENGSITLSTTGGKAPVSYYWSNGSNTQNLNNIEAGTYSCTITEGNGRSIETGDIQVIGPTEPITIFNVSVEDVDCNGNQNGAISLSASGPRPISNIIWNNGESGNTITNLGPGVYTATVYDDNDCTTQATYVISEPDLLELNIVNVGGENCNSIDGHIFSSVFGGVEPYIYELNGQTFSNNDFFNLESGYYDLTVSDNNGCVVSESIVVPDIEGPTAVATAVGELSCQNPTTMLTAEGSTDNNSIFFSWSTNDGNIISSEDGFEIEINAEGTYTLAVLDVDTDCISYADIFVSGDLEMPSADAGEPITLDCNLIQTQLNGTASSGDEFSYEWSTSNGNIVSGHNTLNPIINSTGTYTLTVLNTENGCSSTSSVIVNQDDSLPSITAGEPQLLNCGIQEVTLEGEIDGSSTNLSYSWSTSDGNIIADENTLNPIVNQPGTYTLHVVDNSNGCSVTSNVIVTLDDVSPNIVIEDVDILTCTNQQIDISILNPNEYATIEWSTTNGNIIGSVSGASITVDESGEYIVSVVSAANQCENSTTITVEESIDSPEAIFQYESNDNLVEFNSAMSEGNNLTYSWNFGDGGQSSEANPTYTYTESGTYDVCLTVTNECGSNETCTTINITINSNLSFVIQTSDVSCYDICDGYYNIEMNDTTANYQIVVKNDEGLAYQSILFNDNNLCAGEYNFTITSESGEMTSGTFIINNSEPIEIEYEIINTISCYGEADGSINLQTVGGTGSLHYEWSNGDTTATTTSLSAGNYEVTITDENGCQISANYTLNQPEDILVLDVAITDQTENSLGSIDFDVEGGVEPYTFIWSNGAITEDIEELEAGKYSVVVTDNNGCEKEFGPYQVEFQVGTSETNNLKELKLFPNPVSEILLLDACFSNYQEVSINIINQLGEVFETKKLAGTNIKLNFNMQSMPVGMYYVIIKTNDIIITRKIVKINR